ncbi:armadillo-type protein [Pelagophyceae sp. CCMP2097]|nr:armadillo-type protein [Pelagophyceae sp. CCMP2097]
MPSGDDDGGGGRESGGREVGAGYTPTRLGHKPQCALSASARLAEFPRQGRLDALRPHLERYGLLPRHADAAACEVSYSELKGLVRIWKLHNERHFWRRHATKDDIVSALHAHLQKRKALEQLKQETAARYRREQGDAKRAARSADGGALEGRRAVSPGRALAELTAGEALVSAAQRPTRRDAVSELYMPAVRASLQDASEPPRAVLRRRRGSRADADDADAARAREEADGEAPSARSFSSYVPAHERVERAEKPAEKGMIYVSRGYSALHKPDPRSPNASGSEGGSSSGRGLSSRSLSAAWDAEASDASASPTSAQRALTPPSAADPKMRVKRKCATALLNMSTNAAMQAQFLEQGGLSALLELAATCADADVVSCCAGALVNIIPYGDFYEPARLLDAGVARVLARLALGPDAKVRHFAALCLCRLAAAEDCEDRVVADGGLACATRLLTLPGEPAATRCVAAKVLVNLAVGLDGHNAETVVKNLLQGIAHLSAPHAHAVPGAAAPTAREVLQFCAAALASLSCLAAARPALAKQGVVHVLKALLVASTTPETTNSCAAALCNMGSIHGCRKEMLSLGIIRILARLLKADHLRAGSEPLDAAAAAVEAAAAAVADAAAEETRHLCVLCLTTLSFQKDLRSALLREGALRTIAAVVSSRRSAELTKQGAHALLNFAFDASTREDLVAEGAVPALLGILAPAASEQAVVDAETRAHALMALCNLLGDAATCGAVVDAGAVQALVDAAALPGAEGDLFEYVGVALLNLSTHAAQRQALAEAPGGVALLLALAKSAKSPGTPARAVRALFNVALDEATHAALLAARVVPALAQLVAAEPADAPADVAADALPRSHGSKAGRGARPTDDVSDDASAASGASRDRKRDGRKARRADHAAARQDSSRPLDSRPRDFSRPRESGADALERRAEETRLAAMVVHSLTADEAHHRALRDQGGVELLVLLAAATNDSAKTAVAASFHNLAQRGPVHAEGFLDAVLQLSRGADDARVLWCAWCLADVSRHAKGRAALGKACRTALPALLAMMRSGCADAELVQYHCAVAVCNTLSVFLSRPDVEIMLQDGTVQDIIVITVLRSNAVRTKRVLAQALFNLISREDTRLAMIAQDVPLALIQLAKAEDGKLNALCGAVVHNLSCDAAALAPKLLELKVARVVVDQALSARGGGVALKKLAAATLANCADVSDLLHRALAAPEARVVAGLQAVAVAGDAATLDCVAAVALRLSTITAGRAALVAQGGVAVLTRIARGTGHETSKDSPVPARARRLLVAALRNVSTSPKAHADIYGCAACLALATDTMLAASAAPGTRVDACLLLCNVVAGHPAARLVVTEADVLPALLQLAKAVANTDGRGANALATLVRDLSTCPESAKLLVWSGAMALCVKLAKREDPALKHCVATAVCNLCGTAGAPAAIVEDGAISALFWLSLQDCLGLTKSILRECAVALRHVAQAPALRAAACGDSNLVPLLLRLAHFGACDVVRHDAAVAAYHLLSHEAAQKSLVRQGLVKVLVDLAGAAKASPRIREVCSAALHQLPSHLLTNVDGEMLNVLMGLLEIKDADFVNASLYVPDRSLRSVAPWVAEQTSPAEDEALLDAAGRDDARRKCAWPTSVVSDAAATAFSPARYALDPVAGEQVDPALASGATDLIGAYRKMHAVAPSQLNQASLRLSLAAWIAGEDGEETLLAAQQRAREAQQFDGATIADRLKLHAQAQPAKAPAARAEAQRPPPPVEAAKRLPSIQPPKLSPTQLRAAKASEMLADKTIAQAFRTAPLRLPASAATEVTESPTLTTSATWAASPQHSVARRAAGAKKARQQDRVADDYFELLYHIV